MSAKRRASLYAALACSGGLFWNLLGGTAASQEIGQRPCCGAKSGVAYGASRATTEYAPPSPTARKVEDRLRQIGGAKLFWSSNDRHQVLLGVELFGQNATDRALGWLAYLPELRYLKLSPSSTGRVTDAGLAQLAALQQLEYIGLGGTSVTDAGLGVVRQWPQLRRLELPAAVTDEGLTHLASLESLEQLRVWPARVTNRGLESIANLRCLRSLDLSGSHVDDAGLAALRNLSCLETLNLSRTPVTSAGIAQLIPAFDDDLMNVAGPSLLKRAVLSSGVTLDIETQIRLFGMSDWELPRLRDEPNRSPRDQEHLSPTVTPEWLQRIQLEAFGEEVSFWKALGAYVEFSTPLVDADFADKVPAELVQGPLTVDSQRALNAAFREQAHAHIVGLYFCRPRSRTGQAADDNSASPSLGPNRLPPRLERLSLRDANVSAQTVIRVVETALTERTPLKTLNIYQASRSMEPADLAALVRALDAVERIVVDEAAATALREAQPDLAAKVKGRPRYLEGERAPCCVDEQGFLKRPFCPPESAMKL